MSYAPNLILKYLFSSIVWLLGAYIVLFIMCFYAHVNESNIIAKRTDALLVEITHEGKIGLDKVASVQNMARKTKPIFFKPYTTFNSLFGKRESYKIINKSLGDAIEHYKSELAGIALGQVDLEGADLSWADLHGGDLGKANLSRAELREANLIATKLNWVNLQGASFFNTKVYKADFKGAILNGADFEHAVGLTCKQIESAVIDGNTVMPDYISLAGSSDSSFKCINLRKAKGMDLRRINLSKAHLRYSNFSESDLSHSNFQNADVFQSNFKNANLSKANFQGATLEHSRFSAANLKGADLRGAGLGRALGLSCEQIKSAVIDESTILPDYIFQAGFSGSSFKCINLRKAKGLDLRGMERPKAYLRYSHFNESDLSQSNFQNADLYQSNFQNANLSKASFQGAALEHSRFSAANLTGADLRGAGLGRTVGLTCDQIESAVTDESTILPDYIFQAGSSGSSFKCINLSKAKGLELSGMDRSKAYLHHSDFSESDLSHSNFQNAKLYQSNFQNANLSKANFQGAALEHSRFIATKLTGADLRGAGLGRTVGLTCDQIESAVIDESTIFPDYIFQAGSSDTVFKCINLHEGKGLDLSGMDRSKAFLSHSDFSESDLSHSNLQNADLYQTNFQNANLSKANLKEANMNYTSLGDANLTGADLRGAGLGHALGLTCDQVKSAVIDENTVMPDYISLTGSSGSDYRCENILNKN
jgi:uncharacterized protein YjbI with pentapeptide repeats